MNSIKRTKRQKNAIMIYFLFYLFLFLVAVYSFFSFVYPKLTEVTEIKAKTKEISNNIEKIEKQGISYTDFVKLSKLTKVDDYKTELIKNIDEDFYNKNLINTGEGTYSNFITQKKQFFNNEENKQEFLKKDLKISSILPYFSQSYIGEDDEQSLSNFKFISYVESLLETFSLKHTNSLGITKVNILDDYVSEKGEEKSLETNIYSIPIKLNLKGTKSGIIDFLHYIENVGKIYIEEDDIIIHNDSFLNKNTIKREIEGDNMSKDYNIYAHQIIDIDNIKIPLYLDNSQEYRKNTSFSKFIKSTQGNNIIEIEVQLMFYVKGYPQYKLEQLINNIIDQYKDLLKMVNNKLAKVTDDDFNLVNYKKINEYLKEIKDDINLIKKEMKNKANLENVYKRSVKYKYIFDNINKLLNNEI